MICIPVEEIPAQRMAVLVQLGILLNAVLPASDFVVV